MKRYGSLFALIWMTSPLLAQQGPGPIFSERPTFVDDESIDAHFGEPPTRLISFEEDADLQTINSGDPGHICYDEYCQPFLTLRAGGLVLFLEDTDESISPLIDLSHSAGYYVQAIRHGDGYDFEAMFFGVGDLDGRAPALFGLPGATGTVEAELYNYEFNIRSDLTSRSSFITGFRWVDFDSRTDVSFPPVSQRVVLDNDLYGFQIGVDANLIQTQRFGFDATWKGGVYYNDVDMTLSAPGLLPFPLVGSGGDTAFVTDLWLSMVFQVNCNTALRWGYQLMYLNNVAGANDLSPILAGGDPASSQAFLHGFHGALEWTF